jgi:hypothetical protein
MDSSSRKQKKPNFSQTRSNINFHQTPDQNTLK